MSGNPTIDRIMQGILHPFSNEIMHGYAGDHHIRPNREILMNWFEIFGLAVCAGCFVQTSLAPPMLPAAAMTIEGNVKKISWHPDTFVKGIPGKSGSA